MSAADLLVLSLVCLIAALAGIALVTYLDIRAERAAKRMWLGLPGATDSDDLPAEPHNGTLR